MSDKKCPRCGSPMSDKGTTICANSKYANWECELCGKTETICLGLNIINNDI